MGLHGPMEELSPSVGGYHITADSKRSLHLFGLVQPSMTKARERPKSPGLLLKEKSLHLGQGGAGFPSTHEFASKMNSPLLKELRRKTVPKPAMELGMP